MILSPTIHDAVTGMTYARGDDPMYDKVADALGLPVPGSPFAHALDWLIKTAPLIQGPELPPHKWGWIDPLKDPTT